MRHARLIAAAAASVMMLTVDAADARHVRHHHHGATHHAKHHRAVSAPRSTHSGRRARRHDVRQARVREPSQSVAQRDVAFMRTDSFTVSAPAAEPAPTRRGRSTDRVRSRLFDEIVDAVARPARSAGIDLGGRPSGCPYRFCGCALSLDIFGRIIPELKLAANWVRKFPRTAPAPGMVAARPGHALKLIAHVRGTYWRVWDPNSGRHRIREHERSIAGFVIVDPHASRVGSVDAYAFRS